MREREREATGEILDSLEYYEVTKEIAKKAGQYKRVYREKGVRCLRLSNVK
jgi:predicted nucleic acid-binding protein